jgi:hypothetical protein
MYSIITTFLFIPVSYTINTLPQLVSLLLCTRTPSPEPPLDFPKCLPPVAVALRAVI